MAQYDEIFVSQNGVCAICGGGPIVSRFKNLSVDHCHSTNVIRGLLCGLCNPAIGLMQDDPARLRAAADYLEKFIEKKRQKTRRNNQRRW